MTKVTRVNSGGDWYELLLSDVRRMAFTGIVATKHAIGKRILADREMFGKPEYGSRTMMRLAKDMDISKTAVYDCVQFATQYPELSNVLENLSWREIKHKLLPAPPKKPRHDEPSPDCCSVADLDLLIKQDAKFATIYADPPWQYGNQATRAATGNHYGTMPLADIAAMPVVDLVTENAHLHLWTTNAFLFDAKAIMEAWGFEYKSCLVWVKPQMGLGNYWRVSHEFMLFGLRGKCAFGDHGQMSWQMYDRTKHSEKPHKIRQLIELVSPSPRLELFGRFESQGWTVWGNEIQRQELSEGE